VIVRIGSEGIATVSDWDRALRSNQGKPVQVTILRDKKQQTLTLQVDSKHKQGELECEAICQPGEGAMVAGIDPELAQEVAAQAAASAQAMRDQAQALRDRLQAGEQDGFTLTREQTEQIRKQAEKLRESLKSEEFKIDQKQMDELKRQMEEFRQSFKPEDFKIDPKQMEEFRQQMDQLKRQMEEMPTQGLGNHV
jgi:C-terminal processing protease CtpA/Prc